MNQSRPDETARHPMFDGRPILLGDEITIGDGDDDADGYDTTAVVSTIRMVKGVPWIHVLEPANDYTDHVHERNEIIYADPADREPSTFPGREGEFYGRYVIAHRPTT